MPRFRSTSARVAAAVTPGIAADACTRNLWRGVAVGILIRVRVDERREGLAHVRVFRILGDADDADR